MCRRKSWRLRLARRHTAFSACSGNGGGCGGGGGGGQAGTEGKEMSRQDDIAVARIVGWGHVLDPLGTLTGQPLPDELTMHWTSGIPRYSEDIAAAWTLVEHLHNQGYICYLGYDDIAFHCRLFRIDDAGEPVDAAEVYITESMPEAIVRAFLATVGGG